MKAAKTIFKIFKIAVVILSIAYIVHKLYNDYTSGFFVNYFRAMSLGNIPILIFAVILVFFNWAFESLKFQILVNPIQHINLNTAFKAVLAGVTVSIFTPKRIGDFGGRVFALEGKNRINGIFATLLGSYSQLLITFMVGLGLLPFYLKLNEVLEENYPNINYLFYILAVVILLSLYVYFNVPVIGRYLLRYKLINKYKKFIEFIGNYSRGELLKIIGISFLRYVIFTFQMYILLKLFGIEISYTDAIVGISQIYLYMTAIPTLAIGELGVRGSLSVWVLSVFSGTATGIIAASLTLWVLNLAVPAIIGNYFLWKFKY